MDEILKELARLREENMRLKAEDDDEPQRFFRKPSGVPKPWKVQVFDAAGAILLKMSSKGKLERMEKAFLKASEADRWACLRLTVEGFAGCYATVGHDQMRTVTTLTRDVAMGIVHGRQPGKPGVVQATRPNPEHQPLGFKGKCSQTRVEFSRG
jgi:hypothetical protein